jgi:23S rRNA (guanosine2251-2'-O)-methyltransferase
MARAGIGTELEGVHAVRAALEAGRVETIHVAAARTGPLSAIIELATARGVIVEVVDDVKGTTAAPQGVRAFARPLPLVGIDALAEPAPAAVVVLDHLQDPRNVGAVARSAAASGMTGLVVSDRRAAPLGATAFKAAAGAFERLRVCVHTSTADAIGHLRRAGLWIVGLAAEVDASLFGHALLSEPVAVVVGGEGSGLARLVRDRCDLLVRIPMVPGVESLNAAVAAGLAMFEIGRVRGSV